MKSLHHRSRAAVALLAAVATTATGAALLGPGTGQASSHREAPYTLTDPAVDATDVFAFSSPDKPDTVTLVANFSPGQDPSDGPNFFPWATDARYAINVDNNGDAKPDITYRWTFKDIDKRGAADHGTEVKGSLLYNDGPVTSLDDPNLLFRQTYDLQVVTNPTTTGAATATVLTDVPVPPDNVGVASIPNYVPLRDAAIEAGKVGGGPAAGVQSFAGQRDDPFFLDIRVFDLLYGGNMSETGFNSLAEKNVNTVALQVPKRMLASGGDISANPVIGVWSTSERPKIRTFQETGAAPQTSEARSSDQVDSSGEFVQVSRLAAPLVNEVVVPASLKDYFNRSRPDQDAGLPALVGRVQDPEVPALIESIYKIPNPNKSAMGKDRPDLVATFLTGISKKSYPPAGADLNGIDLNRDNAGVASEQLRLNMATPVSAKPTRLGVLGGDLAGFPNGRRPADDTVDIELQALEGALVPDQDPAVKKAISRLGDGVDSNDKAFMASFPYLADPHAGSDPRNGRSPVKFKQNFTSQGGTVTTNVSGITPAAPGGFVQLYRINADGSSTGLGSMNLDSSGTTSSTKRFRVRPGTELTLNYRVFTTRVSAAQENRGVATTFTVR
ncbi:MAG: DUF4331 domain-containing protein [Dermatophilaceae bacterium]|nr:DUF4331 domain-containing protein [Dermatophilaceae bacterium]